MRCDALRCDATRRDELFVCLFVRTFVRSVQSSPRQQSIAAAAAASTAAADNDDNDDDDDDLILFITHLITHDFESIHHGTIVLSFCLLARFE